MKYSHHQTKYIGKYVGLKTYQHPRRKDGSRKKMCLKLLIYYFHMTSLELLGKKEGILTDKSFSSRNK